MTPDFPTLWPLPREITPRDDALDLTRAALTLPAGATKRDIAPAALLADMIADDFDVVVPVALGQPPAGKLPIRLHIAGRRGAGRPPRNLPGEEGYVLRVTGCGADIWARDLRGAQHAAATLIQLVERRGPAVSVRGAEIRDWPHKPVRMVHLYVPGEDHLLYARRYLRDFLVRYKFNGCFVEVGGGVRLPRRPEIALGWRRFVDELRAIGDTGPIYGEHTPLGPGRRFAASVHTHLADGRYLEPQDLAALADWARSYQLDFVPEIQSLSHAFYLACTYRDIAELPEADFPDTYCPSNPRSYEILFDVMSAYIDLTRCTSVHIGHDEWRAAGLCPQCRQRDTGELFGEDVVKIATWLRDRGLGVWMWGDHLVPKHNARRRSHDNGKVWYDHPSTESAARIIAQGAPQIRMLNWSWWLGAEDADRVLADLGFEQIYGNFDGRRFEDWVGRSAQPGVLGAEVSSWCAWEDFELGRLHYPAALHAANLLWSGTPLPEGEAEQLLAREMPRLRDRMRRGWEKPRLWSVAVAPTRHHVINIHAACNAPAAGDAWDLSGLARGRQEHDGVPFELVDPATNGGRAGVVVARLHQRPDRYPHQSAAIPIGGKYGSLTFWQVATSKGARPVHAGDGTNYPRESAELLGWYEIRFADGLTRAAEVRYAENVLAWDEGYGLLYHAREAQAGRLPDGSPLVIYGLEWTNPRPEFEIESVVLNGARAMPDLRPEGDTSDARPMLLGITATETPKWEDYRPGKAGKLPGMD